MERKLLRMSLHHKLKVINVLAALYQRLHPSSCRRNYSCVRRSFKEANITFDDIDAIAVTEGPGLVGALLIGVNAAKAVAFAHDIPLVGVHHIAGHIYANRLVKEVQFPLLSLVVSGGHTELVYMKEHGSFEVIGETRDDAAGEAYDKVARTLSMPYPGASY